METFVPVIGYEGFYEINRNGVIRSCERIVKHSRSETSTAKRKPTIRKFGNSHGYKNVVLCKNGRNKSFYVHRLLAIHFIPNPDNHPIARFKNGNVEDIRLTNIVWSSQIEAHFVETRPKCRKVKCTVSNRTWNSIASCARDLGMRPVTLTSYLNGFNPNVSSIIYNDLKNENKI